MARNVTLTVFGQDPREAEPPLFANFLAVSHVGNDVQLEFIFLDLNQLALRFGQPDEDDRPGDQEESGKPVELQGKTVAKVVVPVASFFALKDHLQGLFKKFEARYGKPANEETTQERAHGD